MAIENHDRRIFWATCFALALALLSYATLLTGSVFAVVERRASEGKTDDLTKEIARLEAKYAALDAAIDLDLARELGFEEGVIARYVGEGGPGAPVLTMR